MSNDPKAKTVERIFKYAPLIFFPCVVFCTVGVLLDMDYLYQSAIPRLVVENVVVKAIIFMIRYFLLFIPMYLILIPLYAVTIVALFEVVIVYDAIFDLNAWTDYYYAFRKVTFSATSAFLCIRGLNGFPNSKQILLTHYQLKILQQCINDALFYITPSLLLFGGVLLVTNNYATIKMHSTLHASFYLAFPVNSISITAVVLALFPLASNAHEDSRKFARKFYLIHSNHKYWLRVAKTLHPFHFSFGGLFIARKSTQTTYLQCIFDRTVDSLLLS